MRRASVVLGATMLALFAGAASAQKPDFSGTWTLDAEKTQAANPAQQGGGGGGGGGGGRMGGGGMGGGPLTIKVDATSFTTERAGREGAVMTQTYKLDGTPTQIAQGQTTATGKAAWQGSTIVIETTRAMGGNNITTKATYAIEGDYLVVTNETPGRDGGAPMTRKSFYKKS